ncbi:MAG: lysophospholipid acyltransferase family protein [Patescibacteria group bacterium]|jgi:1-acyl-sn-glycerol-3-phosphate acyltransferase
MKIRLNSWIVKPIYSITNLFTKKPEGCENLPQNGAFIIAVNHVSYFDQYILLAPVIQTINRHINFIAKTGNYRIFDAVPIDPKNPAGALEKLDGVLKRGEVVGIFPEGKANPDRELAKGKTGVARLAIINRVPVVPVGIDGPHGSTVKDSFKNFFRGIGRAKIKVGMPITLDKYYNQEITKELLDSATGDVMQEIAKLSGKSYPH